MTLRKLFVALAATLMVSSLSAEYYNDQCCEPCPEDCGINFCCDPCGGFDFYVDYLYWKVRRCDIGYAAPYANLPSKSKYSDGTTGKVHGVNSEYDSGFRIGIQKDCGNIDLGVHYTRFQNSNKEKTLDPDDNLAALWLSAFSTALAIDITSLNYASGKYDIDYDVVDVEAGYSLDMGACLDARVFGGFKYANICQKIEVVYSSDFEDFDNSDRDFIKSKVDMDAYGLYLGADASYTICNNFNLFGNISYAALIGEFDRHLTNYGISQSYGELEYMNLKDDCWQYVSNINLSFGIGYELNNCFCADWTVALGYEFHQYLCMKDFLDYKVLLNGQATVSDDDACLGFDGLFVRVGASF